MFRKVSKNPGNMREMTAETDRLRVFFSCWRNVDNNSAEVIWAGRLYHGNATKTGKARLAQQLTAWQNEEVDGQAGQQREWVVRGIAAWVRARLCMSGRRFWTELAPGRAPNGLSNSQECGRIGRGDMSFTQPHLAPTGLSGSGTPEDRSGNAAV